MKQNTLFSSFIRYTAANVCGMLGLSCYILADTFFVANRLGVNGLTALNLAIPVYSFVHGTGLMLGMGGASKYTILKEQHRDSEADSVFSATLCLAAVFAILFLISSIFFAPQITSLLGADVQVFSMTNTYLKVILLFSPAFLLNDILVCFVRNDKAPKLSMAAMLTGSISNIILDYVFLYPMQMGIFGAVLATGLAPVISLCVLSIHFIRRKNTFHLSVSHPDFRRITSILSLGVPSLITELASGIVIIVFNIIILKLSGNTGVAAYGIIANISLVITAIYTGIAQGCQPIIGKAFGANQLSDIRHILRYALITMVVISCVVYLLLFLLSEPVISAFNSEHDPYLQAIAANGLILYFTAIPFAGFNIILVTYFVAIGKAIPAQIISLLRGFIFLIPIAILLSVCFQLTGVWLSYPLTELLVAIISYFLFHRSRKAETSS